MASTKQYDKSHDRLKSQQVSPTQYTNPIWRLEDVREQLPITEPQFHKWPDKSGRYQPVFYHFRDGFLIRFADFADFTVSQNGDEVTTRPVPGVAQQLINDIYNNLVFPLALSQQQHLVFHSSAIEIDEHCIMFVAESGSGKSTLTASFATNNYRFLADDFVLLDKQPSGFRVLPGHPSLRVWQDTLEALNLPAAGIEAKTNSIGKWQLASSPADQSSSFHCDVARPLKHVYFLETIPTDAIQIQPITKQEAVVGLLSHRFLLDVTNKTVLANNIKDISALASATACFRLSIPNDFGALSNIRANIVAHTRDTQLSTLSDIAIP